MHQSSLKFDHHPAIVLLTRSPGAAQVHFLLKLLAPSAMERMADAYLADVDLDFESDELKGTVNDIVMGTQSRDYTESKSANRRANQGTESFTDHTKSTSKRATARANQSTGCCAKGTVNRKLCRGSSLKVLHMYFKKGVWHSHMATLLAPRSWIVTGVWRHSSGRVSA